MKKLVWMMVLLSGDCWGDWAVNLSVASHHFDDMPDCKPSKSEFCRYVFEEGYNESNPGILIERSISNEGYLLGGIIKNSFERNSLVAGYGTYFIKRRSFATGVEVGGLTNHEHEFLIALFIKHKYFKINYLPGTDNNSDAVLFQLRAEFE